MSAQLRVLHGNALEKLRELPDESVHCIVSSPPYWGLRDYKLPPVIWPRKTDDSATRLCRHKWGANGRAYHPGQVEQTKWKSADAAGAGQNAHSGAFCAKCGAWRGSLGLEPTPELYVEHLVAVLREAKRVLRKDGTLWLNLGDSYVSSAQGTMGDPLHQRGVLAGVSERRALASKHFRNKVPSLKSGDLVGIPWRVVFALQADGWWHRRDNIWFKPNPMPESVNGWRWEKHRVKVQPSTRYDCGKNFAHAHSTPQSAGLTRAAREGRVDHLAEYADCLGCEKCAPNGGLILRKGNWRCTTSHEYVFQFSKSASYFCDAEAARERQQSEPKACGRNSREFVDRDVAHLRRSGNKERFRSRLNNHLGSGVPWTGFAGNRNRRSVWTADGENPLLWWLGEKYPDVAIEFLEQAIAMEDVWRIATAPYPEAHFATFPPALVRPIILAATSPKVCAECGAPYAPVIERGEPRREQQIACGSDKDGTYTGEATKDFLSNSAEDASAVKARILAGMVEKRVIGYRATCGCNCAETARATVLDPFGGSGTVGQVALEAGRAAILIELAEHYLPLIAKRCGELLPLGFASTIQPLNASTNILCRKT